MKLRQVRTGTDVVIADALTFMSGYRSRIEEAYANDIIDLHNHGTVQIGDTPPQGEELKFTVFPISRRNCSAVSVSARSAQAKQLVKGLVQLLEEVAVQVFRLLANNNLIIGAVSVLQFDVVVA